MTELAQPCTGPRESCRHCQGGRRQLVRQLEMGSDKAMGMAASGLALIALKSEQIRVVVSSELVKLLSSDKEVVRQRAAEALLTWPRERARIRNIGRLSRMEFGKLRAPLLCKSRVRAVGSRLVIRCVVCAPCPLLPHCAACQSAQGRVEGWTSRGSPSFAPFSLRCHREGADCRSDSPFDLVHRLRPAGRLSTRQQYLRLAPLAENAMAIKLANGVDPIVQLLSGRRCQDPRGRHLGSARTPCRGLVRASTGARSHLWGWLANPKLGPPDVAARALCHRTRQPRHSAADCRRRSN